LNQRSFDITALLLDYARAAPPEDVRAVMRLSLLDWAVCGMAGRDEGTFAAWAETLGTEGPATRFDGRRATVAEAALINGAVSHALDYDDTHFAHIGHPSVVVFPAALAVAEARGATLAQMVDAALVGAEASIAVGLWLGREHYQVGYHQTATSGAFGATIAAGRLMGLSAPALRHALGLCTTMASGLKSQFGTMGKPLNAGLAARTGVEAAQWAAVGMTSAEDGLAGPLGFGDTHHGAGADVPFAWRMGSVSHKFHACCHGLHASLEAAAEIRDLKAADHVQVEVHPRWLSVCNHSDPQTGLEAKFSYRHVLAMAAHGLPTAEITQFTVACAQRADLVKWRDRVTVTGADALTEMQARIRVGEAVYQADLATMQVSPERFRAKATALVGARADAVLQAIDSDDLTAFVAAITA